MGFNDGRIINNFASHEPTSHTTKTHCECEWHICLCICLIWFVFSRFFFSFLFGVRVFLFQQIEKIYSKNASVLIAVHVNPTTKTRGCRFISAIRFKHVLFPVQCAHERALDRHVHIFVPWFFFLSKTTV